MDGEAWQAGDRWERRCRRQAATASFHWDHRVRELANELACHGEGDGEVTVPVRHEEMEQVDCEAKGQALAKDLVAEIL